jgi:hypothetical protein
VTDVSPTARQVGIAVVAACRETGADPVECIQGEMYCHGPRTSERRFAFARARVYAALAIESLFDCGATFIGRAVGASRSSADTLLSNTRFQLRNGSMRWYDPNALERVKGAVRTDGGASPSDATSASVRAVAAVHTMRLCACGAPLTGAARQCRSCYTGDGGQARSEMGPLPEIIQPRPAIVRVKIAPKQKLVVALPSIAEPRHLPVVVVARIAVRVKRRIVLSHDEFRSPIIMKKQAVPADQCEDLTPQLMGDPPLARSSLANAKPWKPYEAQSSE